MPSQPVHHHASRVDTSHFGVPPPPPSPLTTTTTHVSSADEIAFRGALSAEPHTASSQTLFVDLMEDLQNISSTIESVEQHVRVRRQQRRSVRSLTGATAAAASSDQQVAKSSSRTRRKSAPAAVVSSEPQGRASASGSSRDRSSGGGASQRRKKDDDALDCIYAELQDTVGMCRYWGKKCWNLRVPKAKGGFHSLCHMHRVKANDNQRRFDYKRRGTLWRSFKPDPNYEDVSLFPGIESPSGDAGEHETSSAAAVAANFEPFEQPVPLQDKDVELLHELIGATSI